MLTTGATLKFEQHLFQILFYYFIVKELRKNLSEKKVLTSHEFHLTSHLK